MARPAVRAIAQAEIFGFDQVFLRSDQIWHSSGISGSMPNSLLGPVPSEHASGQKTKRGSITKAGNGHVRRVLTERSGLVLPVAGPSQSGLVITFQRALSNVVWLIGEGEKTPSSLKSLPG